jgi:hypothetical protein
MNAPATLLPDTSAPGRPARDEAYAERQLAVLGRLAEAGLEIAVALEAQAKGGPVVAPGDIAMAYARVARAVRQTIMLQSRLIEAQRAQDESQAARKAAARSSAARLVRGAIEDDGINDTERAERLHAEAAERLQAENFTDLLSRPFGEAVAGICRDLGLSPDWLRLAQDCAEAEAALKGQPGAAPKEAEDDGIQVLWIDPDSPPGETRWYDPAERRRRRRANSS